MVLLDVELFQFADWAIFREVGGQVIWALSWWTRGIQPPTSKSTSSVCHFPPAGKPTCTSNLKMDWTHEEDEMFRPPKYAVNSFHFSVRDDDDESQMDVRRYGKCFYITMAPENFVDSPPIKQQYLDYLAAEKSDVTDNSNMAEDYNLEDFYAWALEPCLLLFETVAPAPKSNLGITIYDFLQHGPHSCRRKLKSALRNPEMPFSLPQESSH